MSDDGERAPIQIRGHAKTTKIATRPTPPALVIPPALSSPLLDPEKHLDSLLTMLERAREEWVEATDLSDNAGVMSLPPDSTEKDIVQYKEDRRNDVRKAWNRYEDLRVRARKAEQELRKARLEQPLAGQWRGEYETLRGSLTDEYEGLGPQYDLLCDNAAATAIRLRQMEASGRDYDSGEYTEMMKLHINIVNQLQKYTEAMKSETLTKQTQEVAETIIRIFESHFGNTYPEVWRRAFLEIKKTIEGAA